MKLGAEPRAITKAAYGLVSGTRLTASTSRLVFVDDERADLG